MDEQEQRPGTKYKLLPFPPPPEIPSEPEVPAERRSSTALTKEQLPEYQEQILVKNARRLLPELARNLKTRLERGDAKAADQVMALYGFVKPAPGAIINNVLNQQVNTDSNSGMYFEKIVKLLEEGERAEVIEAEILEG